MTYLTEKLIYCPYCAEAIEVLIGHEEAGQQYIEDCQVCCKPITFKVTADSAGNVSVSVHDENDTY
jgi:Cysteine-rich CPXCG